MDFTKVYSKSYTSPKEFVSGRYVAWTKTWEKSYTGDWSKVYSKVWEGSFTKIWLGDSGNYDAN